MQDESLPRESGLWRATKDSQRRDADLVFAQYHEPLPDACNAVRWTQGAPTCGLWPGARCEAEEVDGPLLIAGRLAWR